ncbi:exostosin family protein [Histomonas meleagridis]|uniref:exostosin family protein n=1 Tax=Histomonas meleagridis TaxID=135588 RepID=UPI00355A52FB|nr:exostosin family protein [Histomonas meleagridis]KAH0797373.1 exostosin family protein [Histomonas meleagridis]
MNGLWNLISDDFLYVTLSGTDEGMEAGVDMDVPDNVFVLSSGGVGNVPLNLFLRDYEPIQVKENPKYTAVFMGRIGTHKIREEMDKICKETLGDRYFSGFSNEKKWTEIYSNSKAILCPRGNGRNSYRLTEVLQMGLIPIYVYNDIPWVPYYDSIEWEKFGFVTKIGDLAKVLKKIDKMNYTELTEMRNRVRSLSSTHFTVAGAMGQIAKFLKYGFHGTDLRCAERRVLKG